MEVIGATLAGCYCGQKIYFSNKSHTHRFHKNTLKTQKTLEINICMHLCVNISTHFQEHSLPN